MLATGHVQKINYNRQITLPEDVLRKIRVKEFDSLEIFINKSDNTIILKKYDDSLMSSVKYLEDEVKFNMDKHSEEYQEVMNKIKEIKDIIK